MKTYSYLAYYFFVSSINKLQACYDAFEMFSTIGDFLRQCLASDNICIAKDGIQGLEMCFANRMSFKKANQGRGRFYAELNHTSRAILRYKSCVVNSYGLFTN